MQLNSFLCIFQLVRKLSTRSEHKVKCLSRRSRSGSLVVLGMEPQPSDQQPSISVRCDIKCLFTLIIKWFMIRIQSSRILLHDYVSQWDLSMSVKMSKNIYSILTKCLNLGFTFLKHVLVRQTYIRFYYQKFKVVMMHRGPKQYDKLYKSYKVWRVTCSKMLFCSPRL